MRRKLAYAVCAVLLVAGAAAAGAYAEHTRIADRIDRAREFPADPADRPGDGRAAQAVNLAALSAPGCPHLPPAKAPASGPQDSAGKLVEWGAVRVMRCTYQVDGAPAVGLDVAAAFDGPAIAMIMTSNFRRMITRQQFSDYFHLGNQADLQLLVASMRYLFQFPDGHTTEVVFDGRDYYRDNIVRTSFSLRGSALEALSLPGDRVCVVPVEGFPPRYRPCQTKDGFAVV